MPPPKAYMFVDKLFGQPSKFHNLNFSQPGLIPNPSTSCHHYLYPLQSLPMPYVIPWHHEMDRVSKWLCERRKLQENARGCMCTSLKGAREVRNDFLCLSSFSWIGRVVARGSRRSHTGAASAFCPSSLLLYRPPYLLSTPSPHPLVAYLPPI